MIAGMFLLICNVTLLYLLQRERRYRRSARAYARQLGDENEAYRRQLQRFREVIERSGGGLAKRVSEHAEIEHVLSKAPELFIAEPGLRHWLNASRQFHHALAVASDCKL